METLDEAVRCMSTPHLMVVFHQNQRPGFGAIRDASEEELESRWLKISPPLFILADGALATAASAARFTAFALGGWDNCIAHIVDDGG